MSRTSTEQNTRRIRHLIVGGNIAGIDKAVAHVIGEIISVLTAILRACGLMPHNPMIEIIAEVDGSHMTNPVREKLSDRLFTMSDQYAAVVVLLGKTNFQETVNFLIKALVFDERTVVLAWSNGMVTDHHESTGGKQARLALVSATEVALTRPPGLYFTTDRTGLVVRMERGQTVRFDAGSDCFVVA